MQLARFWVYNLRQVILAFAFLIVVITLANQFFINYQVQSQQAISQTLSTNEAYARKVADISSLMMRELQTQLAYSAQLLGKKFTYNHVREQELLRLLKQNDFYNSAVIVNKDAVIVSAEPQTLDVVGIKLHTEPSKQSLRAQAPIVPQPFVSPSGNLILSPSQPILDARSGEYLGYIAGTIYLQGDNVLARVLGTHFHGEKVSISVVSGNGAIIFDNRQQFIGTKLSPKSGLQQAFELSKTRSAGALESSHSDAQLMGFATLAELGWVVIVSTAKQTVVNSVGDTIYDLVYHAAPVTLLTLLGIWLLAYRISAPLHLLAQRVGNNSNDYRGIGLWYSEIRTLKKAFERYSSEQGKRIDALSLATHTDPLTGIGNRRYLQAFLDKMSVQEQPFAVIALDIDHFKRVNDTYGHDVGDKVIQALATLLKDGCREYDGVFRSGGEEFMLLLPGIGQSLAYELAERLRKQVEQHSFAPVPVVTISLGVSLWRNGDVVADVLKAADTALYRAKELGRNQTQKELL